VHSSFSVYALTALFLAMTSPVSSHVQSRDAHEDVSPELRVDSAFVWVPALVNTHDGAVLTHVDADQLRLLDNGNPEKLAQIDTNGLPISLVILMQTGGSARRFLSSYSNLPWLTRRLVGESVHEISLVTFDSRVEQIWHFPARTDGAIYAMTHQHAGDEGAAIKDAVAFGVQQLQNEPGRFRRIVLLLSQGADVDSSTSSGALLEQLGSSSTVIYSLTFPGGKRLARMGEEKHGDSVDRAVEKTNRALDGRTAEEVANLTGGTHHEFEDQGSFNSAMLATLSESRNGITLGFQPSRHSPGFHRIEVRAESPNLRVTARRSYWAAPPK